MGGGEPSTFSLTWKFPLLVMALSVGRMSLLNVTFIVADNETAREYFLVGLPVLRHLLIVSRMFLEQNWSTFNGTYCSAVDNTSHPSYSGHLVLLIISRLQGLEQ